MYLPRWVWLTFIVIAGIYWIYMKFIAEPAFQEKERQYIGQGLAKERDSYLMRQVHTYYFTKPISMDEILSRIDLVFLEKQADLFKDPVLKKLNVGVANQKLFLETPVLTTKLGFQAIFEQVSDSNGRSYQAIVSHCNGIGTESSCRLVYNVFLTHIEEVLNRIDNAVEVERKIMK